MSIQKRGRGRYLVRWLGFKSVVLPTREADAQRGRLGFTRVPRVLFEWQRNVGYGVELVGSAPPPYLNFPSRMLRFVIQGWRDADKPTEPADIAQRLGETAAEVYVPAAEVWREDDPLENNDDALSLHSREPDEAQT